MAKPTALGHTYTPSTRARGFVLWPQPSSKRLVEQIQGVLAGYSLASRSVRCYSRSAPAGASSGAVRIRANGLFSSNTSNHHRCSEPDPTDRLGDRPRRRRRAHLPLPPPRPPRRPAHRRPDPRHRPRSDSRRHARLPPSRPRQCHRPQLPPDRARPAAGKRPLQNPRRSRLARMRTRHPHRHRRTPAKDHQPGTAEHRAHLRAGRSPLRARGRPGSKPRSDEGAEPAGLLTGDTNEARHSPGLAPKRQTRWSG